MKVISKALNGQNKGTPLTSPEARLEAGSTSVQKLVDSLPGHQYNPAKQSVCTLCSGKPEVMMKIGRTFA